MRLLRIRQITSPNKGKVEKKICSSLIPLAYWTAMTVDGMRNLRIERFLQKRRCNTHCEGYGNVGGNFSIWIKVRKLR